MPEFTKVATLSEVPPGQGKTVEYQGEKVGLFNYKGQIYAIDDVCAHMGANLAEGSLEDKVVICPWHGWKYDVTTGVCCDDPSVKQRCFQVKVEGSDILISKGA